MMMVTFRGWPSWPSPAGKWRMALGTVLACLVLGLAFGTPCPAGPEPSDPPRTSEAEPPPEAAPHVPGTGTITGTVRYTRDAKHPWRLGRYYIKNPKTGELAEAVVALYRRGLKVQEPERKPETLIVNQKDFQFTPETIAVRAGDRVRFLNSDNQIHNVKTVHRRQSFNVNMAPGGEHVETFAHAGGVRQPYFIGCAYHSAMRAWVFVFDHPWFQLTGKNGAFRLTNVPPGEYRLDVAHPAGELRSSQTITVKADETVSIEVRLSPDDRVKAPS